MRKPSPGRTGRTAETREWSWATAVSGGATSHGPDGALAFVEAILTAPEILDETTRPGPRD